MTDDPISEYLATLPQPQRDTLAALQATLRDLLPDARGVHQLQHAVLQGGRGRRCRLRRLQAPLLLLPTQRQHRGAGQWNPRLVHRRIAGHVAVPRRPAAAESVGAQADPGTPRRDRREAGIEPRGVGNPATPLRHDGVMVTGIASVSAGTAPVDVLDVADAATVAMRRARAAQLDRVHEVVVSGRWYVHGFRSPQAWLATTTGEAPGACSLTLQLAERIQHMPLVKDRFTRGVLAESALRLLADTWRADLADVFARDERMLVGWALNLTHRDFKMVLATWRLHADPDGSTKSAQDRFESRKLHLSELLDGMGRLDGLLDPEGMKLVREAIRVLSTRTDDDERTPEQRRADALVAMAKQVLANLEPTPGAKRNRPKLIATINVDRPDRCHVGRGARHEHRAHHAHRRGGPADGLRRRHPPIDHRARWCGHRLRPPDPQRVRRPVRSAHHP